ncbi:hypothetical protein BGX26_006845, partial [Mortierella sp. AD094]
MEDMSRDQAEFKEASSHNEQAIEDCPIDDQEQPKQLPLSDSSLKRKASYNNFPSGRKTPIKSAKQNPEIPICSSQELALTNPHSQNVIPDNQITYMSNTTPISEVAIHCDKTPTTFDSTPDLLSFNHVRVVLQDYYESSLIIQRVSGDSLDLESCYINLAIVEAPDQRQMEKEERKAQATIFHRMPSYEKIAKTNMKAPIPLEELFNQRKLRDGREDAPRTILVQGRAGIGKTTLCKKLVHAYQSGLWRDHFDAVHGSLYVNSKPLKHATSKISFAKNISRTIQDKKKNH